LVRGERGEINNFDAIYLSDFRAPIRVQFERNDAGGLEIWRAITTKATAQALRGGIKIRSYRDAYPTTK
jgi:hypothetical protein